jgi:hypothetical protein
VARKKVDPLWEIVGEKIALQSEEPGFRVPCPHCHVPLHLGVAVPRGERVTCGLCGGLSEAVESPEGICLRVD